MTTPDTRTHDGDDRALPDLAIDGGPTNGRRAGSGAKEKLAATLWGEPEEDNA